MDNIYPIDSKYPMLSLGDLVVVPTRDGLKSDRFYGIHGFGIIIKVENLPFNNREHQYTVLFTRSKRKLVFLRDGIIKHGENV